jgi:hypothetical protein
MPDPLPVSACVCYPRKSTYTTESRPEGYSLGNSFTFGVFFSLIFVKAVTITPAIVPKAVATTATCAPNEVVTGGGYIASANFDIRKEVKNGNSWQIDVIGETGSQFQTVAECLRIGS